MPAPNTPKPPKPPTSISATSAPSPMTRSKSIAGASVRKPTGATPSLKLFRGDPAPEPVNAYKFPAPPENQSRQRLVAARVNGHPFVDRRDGAHPAPAVCESTHPDCVCKITTSDQLIRDIESTLDRMQHRLNDFRQQVDDAFKFPTPTGPDDDDPHRPYAA